MEFVFLIGMISGATAASLIGLTLLLIAMHKIDV
jgi:uncharacterized membrane protein